MYFCDRHVIESYAKRPENRFRASASDGNGNNLFMSCTIQWKVCHELGEKIRAPLREEGPEDLGCAVREERKIRAVAVL